jgi:hypothetical protein
LNHLTLNAVGTKRSLATSTNRNKKGVWVMRMICNAVRAVTVEFCGVALVVWVLFGFASLGMRGGEAPQTAVKEAPASSSHRPLLSSLAGIAPSDQGFFDLR